MHSLAFIRIFNVAFGTKCIHVHFYASYVGCIFIACCIHVHPMHKMHSCAFLVCCILYMSHCNAFWCILSLMHFRMCCIWCTWYIHVHCRMCAFWTWCIQAHLGAFTCVAFWCILIMMHSCALPYVCILNVMHLRAFLCMQMRCILMHSNYDAFMCINSYSSSRRRNMRHARRW